MKTFLPSLKYRSDTVRHIRQFFNQHEFLEVFSPLLVKEVNTEPHIDYFRLDENYLIASPELALKDVLFQIFLHEGSKNARVFQLGSVFRNSEPLGSGQHAQEFLMAEYYHPCRDMTEGILFFCELLHAAGGKSREFRGQKLQIVSISDLFYQRTGLPLHAENPSCLIQALKQCNPHSTSLRNAEQTTWNELFFEVYVSALEPWLRVQELVALTEFPRSITSMARPTGHDAHFVDRFELIYRGMELCNGYMENFHPDLLEQQMKADRLTMLQKRPLPEKWLGRARDAWPHLRQSPPQICGVSFGVERVMAMAQGKSEISDYLWPFR